MSVISQMFAEMHSENIPEAPFTIGEEVVYNPLREFIPNTQGKKFIITGLSYADDDALGNRIYEISLQGFPYLVYDNELEKPVDATYCKKCGAPKTKFKCDYCLV